MRAAVSTLAQTAGRVSEKLRGRTKGGKGAGMDDPAIERIEAELRESRFKAWDVETFLANRHQSKIDALKSSQSPWRPRWQVAKEIGVAVLAFIGYLTVVSVAAGWLLTGDFPLHRRSNGPPIDITAPAS